MSLFGISDKEQIEQRHRSLTVTGTVFAAMSARACCRSLLMSAREVKGETVTRSKAKQKKEIARSADVETEEGVYADAK